MVGLPLHEGDDLLHFMERETEVAEPDPHRPPKLLFFPLHPATSLSLFLCPAWHLVCFGFYPKIPSKTGQD